MHKGILFVGGLVLGTLIVPGVSVAKTVTDVFITNDANNPVPVAAQGTTQVAGTVDVGHEPSSSQPYQKTIFFNQDGNACTTFVCVVSFDAVPAGKRLVITYASAQWALTSGGNFATATVGLNGNAIGQPQVLLPPAVLAGFVNWVTAGPLTLYAEAGDVPTIGVAGQFVQPLSNTAIVSLVGYYVDV